MCECHCATHRTLLLAQLLAVSVGARLRGVRRHVLQQLAQALPEAVAHSRGSQGGHSDQQFHKVSRVQWSPSIPPRLRL